RRRLLPREGKAVSAGIEARQIPLGAVSRRCFRLEPEGYIPSFVIERIQPGRSILFRYRNDRFGGRNRKYHFLAGTSKRGRRGNSVKTAFSSPSRRRGAPLSKLFGKHRLHYARH